MAYTTVNKAKDHFNSLTYTGNGASPRSITGVGFRPDLVWTKDRSDSSTQPWHDIVRGATYAIRSDSDAANENTPAYGYINAFDSDGYTMQQGSSDFGRFNDNSNLYVSFNWKAGNAQGSSNTDGSTNTTYTSVNTTAGFSISQYAGSGSAATIGHGLGVAPKLIIVKELTSTDSWVVGHDSLGWGKNMILNGQNAEYSDSTIWNGTAPTSSVFSVGSSASMNASGQTYIAYCFAEKTGYSKFGSYKGNANADGPFIYTGFRPSFVIIKRYNSTKDWFVWDAVTSPRNPTNAYGRPNASTAWGSYDWLDFVSNGIKIRNTSDGASGSGDSYLYWAFGQSLVGTNNVVANAR